MRSSRSPMSTAAKRAAMSATARSARLVQLACHVKWKRGVCKCRHDWSPVLKRLERRAGCHRGDRPGLPLAGKTSSAMSVKAGPSYPPGRRGAIGLSHYGRAALPRHADVVPMSRMARKYREERACRRGIPIPADRVVHGRVRTAPPTLRGGLPGARHPEFRCALRHSGVAVPSAAGPPVTFLRKIRGSAPGRAVPGGTVRAEGGACSCSPCRPRARRPHDVEGSHPECADAARCSPVCSRRSRRRRRGSRRARR